MHIYVDTYIYIYIYIYVYIDYIYIYMYREREREIHRYVDRGTWPGWASPSGPSTPAIGRGDAHWLPNGVRTNVLLCRSAIHSHNFAIFIFVQFVSLVVQHMMHAKHKSCYCSGWKPSQCFASCKRAAQVGAYIYIYICIL